MTEFDKIPTSANKDYYLIHTDLTITFTDEDAFFYEKDGVAYIDHSPDTLRYDSPKNLT